MVSLLSELHAARVTVTVMGICGGVSVEVGKIDAAASTYSATEKTLQ